MARSRPDGLTSAEEPLPAEETSKASAEPVLTVDSLVKSFRVNTGRGRHMNVRAVDDVSCTLARAEILGLAGGSGSGKTTLARCIIRLMEPDSGLVRLGDVDMLALRGRALREARSSIQMVFQDPYSSLNPRQDVGKSILEVGRVHHKPGAENPTKFVNEMLGLVQLGPQIAHRRPRELSGGQRQRVAIARALAADPKILIADEAVSALDVSVQAQLLTLFCDLRDELGLSIIFVAHQLAVLAAVADRVAVMQTGQIVEIGATRDIFTNPQHSYTQALLSAHPHSRPARGRTSS